MMQPSAAIAARAAPKVVSMRPWRMSRTVRPLSLTAPGGLYLAPVGSTVQVLLR
ncbi:hypothetical protein [Sulfobacillus thermotolerans]|uniref:hypothetical protein n=1 Tax=Sulfobacillus thermotolerans TaxID=338644 RepID=UPI0033689128